MYKLLLCWRYLRTRYIALVCIISVTLGVATLIVVNSVMAGWIREMENRLNGVLGDLVFESRSMDGALDADFHMAKMRRVAGDAIVGMSPTVSVPALMYIDIGGESLTRQVTLVGVDEATYASVSAFDDYLQHPGNRKQLSFALRDGGYDVFDHQAPKTEKLMPRERMRDAGWRYRRYRAMIDRQIRAQRAQAEALAVRQNSTAAQPAAAGEPAPSRDPFAQGNAKNGVPQGRDFDPSVEQHTGLILGMSVCSFRAPDQSDQFFNIPGDDVRVSFPKASLPPEAISEFYTIVDFYESKMSEYDSSFAMVPLRHLQESRGMVDPTTGVAKFTSIQIKLKPGVDANVIRDKLQVAYQEDARLFLISTWQDKQGALLSAIAWETRVLNILLFMIIAVAGFGIFAIFCMIVVEKTRDIGILKSLGASAWGILSIFLAYGLSLGLVGAGLGTALGFCVVANINELTALISSFLGYPIIDPNIYYFNNLQTYVRPWTVAWIVAGAVVIAVMSSIMPAMRAARLHPVRALRFE